MKFCVGVLLWVGIWKNEGVDGGALGPDENTVLVLKFEAMGATVGALLV